MIPPEDLQWSLYPDHGRGGQHVGTPTGVKVEHLPTGTIVCVMAEHSQYRNREIALDGLLAILTHPKMRR